VQVATKQYVLTSERDTNIIRDGRIFTVTGNTKNRYRRRRYDRISPNPSQSTSEQQQQQQQQQQEQQQ